jgi:hypothetical protein
MDKRRSYTGRQSAEPAGLLTLMDGTLMGIIGAYLATLSVPVTVVAATAAVVVAGLALILDR